MNVELRPAFAWDCPECYREIFVRAIVPEFSPEESAELREEHGVQPWEEGDFLMQPTKVWCKHCEIEFTSVNYKDA